MEKIDVSIQIFALTHPREKIVQMQVNQIRSPVHYLDESMQPRGLENILKENVEVARLYFKEYIHALFYVMVSKRIDQGYIASNRWNCFLQAVQLIHLLVLQEQTSGKKIDHLHAHFAHDPALIAYLVHFITGIPFSFTAHARDLHQVPEKVLIDRILESSAVVTCCRANLEYLTRIAPSEELKFSLVYHGVDLNKFRPVPIPDSNSIPKSPLILSVGRLVEKKDFRIC